MDRFNKDLKGLIINPTTLQNEKKEFYFGIINDGITTISVARLDGNEEFIIELDDETKKALLEILGGNQ